MFLAFTVGNYRSYQHPVTINMMAEPIKKGKEPLHSSNLFSLNEKSDLLKVAALYGANASGKSNLFKAIEFMRHFVLRSTQGNSTDLIDAEPYLLNKQNMVEPSLFEVAFQIENTQYRYGFEVTAEGVSAEWLYRKVKREVLLFERTGSEIQLKTPFKEAKGIEERTRDNALFLSTADQWGVKTAGEIIQWFRSLQIVSGLHEKTHHQFLNTLSKLQKQGEQRDQVLQLMKGLDLGIMDIRVEKQTIQPPRFVLLEDSPKYNNSSSSDEWFVPKVKTIHSQFGEENQWVGTIELDLEQHESDGTQKAFALSGMLLDILQTGSVLWIDELDARLHPRMTKYIVDLFHRPETNPNNAQLIFSTHDTNLLDNQLFRRDQIWFAEKNEYGSTDLFSLLEYKGVRNNDQFENAYLDGQYGAVPHLSRTFALDELK